MNRADDPGPAGVRLVAGSVGPERREPRPDPDEPRWFEPLHIRDPQAARERVAAAVAAGADVIVAPTWLTHRRALLPIGETRRARAWSEAAVRIARQGVELGLEQRVRAAVERASAPEPGAPSPERLPVLVAGWVAVAGAEREMGSGRVAAPEPGGGRDLDAQAGILAEAGADLLLAEGAASVEAVRAAAGALAGTGLPAWLVAEVGGADGDPVLASGETLGAWVEAAVHAGAAAILLAPERAALVPAGLDAARRAGASVVGLLPALDARAEEARIAEEALRWLDEGARIVGMGDGATPERLTALRSALDARIGAAAQERAAEEADWAARVANAARRAPGGRAAFVRTGAGTGSSLSLPPGFAWTRVEPGALAGLPAGAFRLVVLDAEPDDPGAAAAVLAALEPGGILLARCSPVAVAQLRGDPRGGTLRVLDLAEIREPGPRILLARREQG